MVVLAFFAMTAWNTINDLETHSNAFSGNYKSFQTRVENLSGYNFHEQIHHNFVTQFAEQIVLYMAYASIAFCVLALLKPCIGTIPAFMWLMTQVLEHEFLELTQNRNLKELEVLALTLAVFVSGLLVSCNGNKSKKCCPIKNKKTKTSNATKHSTPKRNTKRNNNRRRN